MGIEIRRRKILTRLRMSPGTGKVGAILRLQKANEYDFAHENGTPMETGGSRKLIDTSRIRAKISQIRNDYSEPVTDQSSCELKNGRHLRKPHYSNRNS
jgi:hypothetical protein